MNLELIYKIVVVIFTVSNLAAMGLESTLRDAIKTLGDKRFIFLTILWGWVVGPAIAYLIGKVIPLSDAHVAGLMLISMAPAAPFYPMMVRTAKGDMKFAAAFILFATVCTVVFLPVLVPFLIEGLEVSPWSLGKPLLITVLAPLLIGIVLKSYWPEFSRKLHPVMKKTGTAFLLLTAILTGWLYWEEMLSAVGSFAIGAQVLFFVIISILSYKIGLRLDQTRRSALSLGMSTRNIAAVFVAYFGITNPDPGIFVMIVLVVPLALIVSAISARIFARYAPPTA
jgi:bile acid:Na+ symporter, BASS family